MENLASRPFRHCLVAILAAQHRHACDGGQEAVQHEHRAAADPGRGAGFADAAMFALRDAGYGTAFQQLVGCMISIRTRDEVSLPASMRLFERAPDAETISRMDAKEIEELIHPATFHGTKAHQIREMAMRITEEFEGELPCDFETMTSFKGIGPEVREPGARRRVRPDSGERRHPRAPRDEPLGLHRDDDCRRETREALETCCRGSTGSRSTDCSCRSASTYARGSCRSARRVRCWSIAGRWE